MSKYLAKVYIIFSCLVLLSGSISCGRSSEDPVVFEIKIENISPTPSFGPGVINLFSSTFAAIHLKPNFLFTRNQKDYGQGLQDLAENGDVSKLLQSLRAERDLEVVGVANEPSSGTIGTIAPGQSFTLLLSAVNKDARLSLATCFLQGNDILVMTPDEGVPLFDNGGNPISGDITSQLSMYDIGTEVNEQPGVGPNQVLRQDVPPEGQVSAGGRESQPVRLLSDVNDGFSYPGVQSSIRISIQVRQFGN